MLFLHNTSRVDGVKYDDLLRVKGFRGFPTIAFMDAEGEVLTSSVDRSVKGFESVAAALASSRELAKAEKAGKLDADGTAKLILAEIDLGKHTFASASQRAAAMPAGASAATKSALDARLLDLEIAGIFAKHQEAAQPEQQKLMASMRSADGTQPTPEARAATQAALAKLSNGVQDATVADLKALLANKRVPSDKSAVRFWNTLRLHAQRHKDDAMVARAKQEMEAVAARDPSQKNMVERMLNPTQGRPATPIRPAGDGKGEGAKKTTASGGGN